IVAPGIEDARRKSRALQTVQGIAVAGTGDAEGVVTRVEPFNRFVQGVGSTGALGGSRLARQIKIIARDTEGCDVRDGHRISRDVARRVVLPRAVGLLAAHPVARHFLPISRGDGNPDVRAAPYSQQPVLRVGIVVLEWAGAVYARALRRRYVGR